VWLQPQVRELASLSSPWYFGAVPKGNASYYGSSWNTAFDPEGLAGDYGLRTAERRHPKYFCDKPRPGPGGGCCSWSGPMWPFGALQSDCSPISFVLDSMFEVYLWAEGRPCVSRERQGDHCCNQRAERLHGRDDTRQSQALEDALAVHCDSHAALEGHKLLRRDVHRHREAVRARGQREHPDLLLRRTLASASWLQPHSTWLSILPCAVRVRTLGNNKISQHPSNYPCCWSNLLTACPEQLHGL